MNCPKIFQKLLGNLAIIQCKRLNECSLLFRLTMPINRTMVLSKVIEEQHVLLKTIELYGDEWLHQKFPD